MYGNWSYGADPSSYYGQQSEAQPPLPGPNPPLPSDQSVAVNPAPPVEPPPDEKPPLPPDPPPEEGRKELAPKNPIEHQKLTALQMQAQQWQAQQEHEQWAKYEQEMREYEIKMAEWTRLHGGGDKGANEIKEQIKQLDDEEKEFEDQYNSWMKQYTDWKVQNQNHPDQDQFSQYEQQWKQYKEQMDSKKAELQGKRDELNKQLSELQSAQTQPVSESSQPPQASATTSYGPPADYTPAPPQSDYNKYYSGVDTYEAPPPRGPPQSMYPGMQRPRFGGPRPTSDYGYGDPGSMPRPDYRGGPPRGPRFGGPERYGMPRPGGPERYEMPRPGGPERFMSRPGGPFPFRGGAPGPRPPPGDPRGIRPPRAEPPKSESSIIESPIVEQPAGDQMATLKEATGVVPPTSDIRPRGEAPGLRPPRMEVMGNRPRSELLRMRTSYSEPANAGPPRGDAPTTGRPPRHELGRPPRHELGRPARPRESGEFSRYPRPEGPRPRFDPSYGARPSFPGPHQYRPQEPYKAGPRYPPPYGDETEDNQEYEESEEYGEGYKGYNPPPRFDPRMGGPRFRGPRPSGPKSLMDTDLGGYRPRGPMNDNDDFRPPGGRTRPPLLNTPRPLLDTPTGPAAIKRYDQGEDYDENYEREYYDQQYSREGEQQHDTEHEHDSWGDNNSYEREYSRGLRGARGFPPRGPRGPPERFGTRERPGMRYREPFDYGDIREPRPRGPRGFDDGGQYSRGPRMPAPRYDYQEENIEPRESTNEPDVVALASMLTEEQMELIRKTTETLKHIQEPKEENKSHDKFIPEDEASTSDKPPPGPHSRNSPLRKILEEISGPRDEYGRPLSEREPQQSRIPHLEMKGPRSLNPADISAVIQLLDSSKPRGPRPRGPPPGLGMRGVGGFRPRFGGPEVIDYSHGKADDFAKKREIEEILRGLPPAMRGSPESKRRAMSRERYDEDLRTGRPMEGPYRDEDRDFDRRGGPRFREDRYRGGELPENRYGRRDDRRLEYKDEWSADRDRDRRDDRGPRSSSRERFGGRGDEHDRYRIDRRDPKHLEHRLRDDYRERSRESLGRSRIDYEREEERRKQDRRFIDELRNETFPENVKASSSREDSQVKVTSINEILADPGRTTRPPHIVIILRGLPGTGKTYLSKLIKDKEVALGGSAPRMLCLDDYFMTEVDKVITDEAGKEEKKSVLEYEYEPEMEELYRDNMFKSYKKQIDNGYFNFIIVDAVNAKRNNYKEFVDYGRKKKFIVYIAELEADIEVCAKRNVHNRTLEDIKKIHMNWQRTPLDYTQLDVRPLLQEATEVQIVEAISENSKVVDSVIKIDSESDEDMANKKSKWEIDTSEKTLDKLDGFCMSKKGREEDMMTMDEYLHLTDAYRTRTAQPGSKRVRWADMEEQKDQQRARDIGFVVGQTNWDRMTDDDYAHKALNRTKYI